ncbi:TauD/TfdA family dioxygenase [Halomonas cupida]|nr:TauD/TfdA family dioxygenase [Halomonas cupida]SHM51512.1 gamma-butyrobetaine dioxygenase [Halomonas cupida]
MSSHASPCLTDAGRQLSLPGPSGPLLFDALWLRERAPDADTLDPATGQRLIEAAELPLDLSITRLDSQEDLLTLEFSDGHLARFPMDDLCQAERPTSELCITLWDAQLDTLPRADFTSAVDDDQALLAMLEAIHQYGFVRVDGVPCEADGMQTLIDRIGPLRHTNWGGIADVRSVANAYDLTMTQRGLEPHTDNPYRDPIPGYIWLHCLTNAAEGGDSTLVDGFEAARRLREQQPQAFDCLTRVRPDFRYQDDSTRLASEGPLIETDGADTVRRVRYSNRTERVALLPSDQLREYYAARQAFYRLISSDELTLKLKLDPGQMLIMDNYRLLHGRTAFQLAGGVRHLRQGYVDRDSTQSRHHWLREHLAPTSRSSELHRPTHKRETR